MQTNCSGYTISWSSEEDPNFAYIRNRGGLQPRVTLQNKVSTYKLVVTENCTGTKDSVEIVFQPTIISAPVMRRCFCYRHHWNCGSSWFDLHFWFPSVGLSDTTVARPQISYTGQNNLVYTLRVDDGNGCQVEEERLK
ncbi:MAG: hypothetical protein R2784_02235 [Saprospiraceae bacterium]